MLTKIMVGLNVWWVGGCQASREGRASSHRPRKQQEEGGRAGNAKGRNTVRERDSIVKTAMGIIQKGQLRGRIWIDWTS